MKRIKIEDLIQIVEEKKKSISISSSFHTGRKHAFDEILKELKKLNKDDEGK